MPFQGVCLTCNHTVEGDTKKFFGDALIEHHRENKGVSYQREHDVFQCQEFDGSGKPGRIFGLDVLDAVVCHSWTGELWYKKTMGKERI